MLQRTKWIWTIITLGGWASLNKLWNVILTPITAVATSDQLNDKVSSFVWAKLVREGFVSNVMLVVALVLLVVIWFPKQNKQ